MSSSLSNVDVANIVRLLSRERLSKFSAISNDYHDVVLMHQKSMLVSAAMMPVIGMIEIALRNTICDCLDDCFTTQDWLDNPPSPFKWKGDEAIKIKQAQSSARRAMYAKMDTAEKNRLDNQAYPKGAPSNIRHEKRVKERQKQIKINRGQVIAQLTLFFWKRLFSSDYEPLLWKRALKKIFPNKQLMRADIAFHLEHLYVARNRIAHHEPMFENRIENALKSIEFIRTNFEAQRPNQNNGLFLATEPFMLNLEAAIREAH